MPRQPTQSPKHSPQGGSLAPGPAQEAKGSPRKGQESPQEPNRAGTGPRMAPGAPQSLETGPAQAQEPRDGPGAHPEQQGGDDLGLIRAILGKPQPLSVELLDQDHPFRKNLLGGVYMGPAVTPPKNGRKGRPATRTQYDDAAERRSHTSGLLRRHVHQKLELPALGRGRAASRAADPAYQAVLRAVKTDERIKPHQQVSEVLRRLDRISKGHKALSRKTVKGDLTAI